MFQKTLTKYTVYFSGYLIFEMPSTSGTRCLITLVRATILSSVIANRPHYGDEIESLAFEIYLNGFCKLYMYNRPGCRSLGMSEVSTSVSFV